MKRDQKWITAWLLIGVIMVFVQILLGGITRLTGSGLSITKWDIVTGTLPPLNETEWNQTFELYKATPQYEKINEGMLLHQFKYIFFWEYLHRLWARSMGFVFLLPFCFFLIRRSLSGATLFRLYVVIGLAGLAAVFGWIMVASGLVERPWVNAYKLTIHLCLGISLLLALLNAWLSEAGFSIMNISRGQYKFLGLLTGLGIFQILLGGMVSGMKSALNYPTWPKMQGQWLPTIVLDPSHWNIDNFLLYDHSGFMPALVQFLHRNTAYLIVFMVFLFVYQWKLKYSKNNWIPLTLLGIIVVQVLLGIFTLLGSVGSIPVFYGAMHQAVGILFIAFLFYLNRITTEEKN